MDDSVVLGGDPDLGFPSDVGNEAPEDISVWKRGDIYFAELDGAALGQNCMNLLLAALAEGADAGDDLDGIDNVHRRPIEDEVRQAVVFVQCELELSGQLVVDEEHLVARVADIDWLEARNVSGREHVKDLFSEQAVTPRAQLEGFAVVLDG